MAGSSPPSRARSVSQWSAAILGILLAVAAGLIFAAIYIALPVPHHYWALVAIGILCLFFAFGSYLAEALSRRPIAQRALAWGFFAMGFAILIVTVALGPMYGTLTVLGQLIGLFVVILALIVAVAVIGWRMRSEAATEERLARRAAWQASQPASALDYPAAHGPTVPQVPTPPPGGNAPPRSP